MKEKASSMLFVMLLSGIMSGRLKENKIMKGMPHSDSFNLSMYDNELDFQFIVCGSIADKAAIYSGYKNE